LLESLEPDPELDDVLAALESRDFIVHEAHSVLAGDEAFSFRHMSLRDVCYNTLPRAERRERHAAVARLLEEASGERPRALAPIMAHHWKEAGDEPRAVEYLFRAAEQADESWAKQEAASLYSQVLDLLPEGDSRRRSVALKRGLAFTAIEHIKRG